MKPGLSSQAAPFVPSTNNVLLDIRNLRKYYPIRGGLLNMTKSYVKAVDDVSFQIYKGEVLGVVGESGCGKSTVGLSILRLEEPTDGRVWFEDQCITDLKKKEMMKFRRKMQLVFQDPLASLNPRKTVRQTIGEALEINNWETPKIREARLIQISEEVGIREQHLDRLPHEFSGGQRQRICIARALVMHPRFVVADEAVSALDVSIQAQVINLLKRLRDKYGLTYLFISHDMRVIRHICDRIAVMYLGKIVEIADKQLLFNSPAHPYTQALLSAVPRIKKRMGVNKIILKGDVGSPINTPSGCRFHPRCPKAFVRCNQTEPKMKAIGKGHVVACHLDVN